MGLKEDFQNKKVKFIKTFILCFQYITLGYGIAIIGPTMFDLKNVVQTSISSMSYMLIFRAIGTLTSCLLTNFHQKYLKVEQLIVVSQLMMGISLFVFPLNPNLWGLNLTIFVYGYFGGCFQVFGDLWTMSNWDKKRASIYIQWVYFFFSLGAFIAPLLAEPFLLEQVDPLVLSTINVPKQNSALNLSLSTNSTLSKQNYYTLNDVKIMYPYMIIGIYAILAAFLFLSIDKLFLKNKSSQNNRKYNSKINQLEDEKQCLINSSKYQSSIHLSNNQTMNEDPIYKPNLMLIKILSILFINLFIGFDVTFGTYLTVFVVKNPYLQLTQKQGAFITAAFWGSYTFAFRLPGYYVIQKYGPSTLMNIELLITFFSTILLVFSTQSLSLMWTSVILEGLGMSIVYSTYLAYLKIKFEPSAKLLSAFVFSFCFGTFLYPFIVGYFIESHIQIFTYLCIFCCLTTTIIYLWVRFLFRNWSN